MIFFRAFPFSFSILWRYVIALPVLILAMILFGIVAVILTAIFMLLSPFLGTLFAVAFGFGVSVVPLMVGMRVGLQGRRVRARTGYMGIVMPALGYGFFEAMCILFLLIVTAGLALFATPITLTDLTSIQTIGFQGIAMQLLSIDPTIAWAIVGFFALATFALRACLLVPFAGASVGADPDGRKHTPFYGFGSGFASVFALVLVTQIGLTFVYPITIYLFETSGYSIDLAARLEAAGPIEEWRDLLLLGPEFGMFIAAGFLVSLFFFSLQCAGAVLVFLEKRAAFTAGQKAWDEAMLEQEEERPAPMEETDLLELVRSRMPDKKY